MFTNQVDAPRSRNGDPILLVVAVISAGGGKVLPIQRLCRVHLGFHGGGERFRRTHLKKEEPLDNGNDEDGGVGVGSITSLQTHRINPEYGGSYCSCPFGESLLF